MKVNCEFCGKNINKPVVQNITKNEIGRIQCPHCHKENKRYISEFDLLYCFLVNATVYGLTVVLFNSVTNTNFGLPNQYFFFLYFGMIAVTITIIYLFTKRTNLRQYAQPVFKKEWMNQKIDEDAEEVGKRMNFNLTIFIVVAIVVGMQPEWFYLFLMMYIAFILITAIKVNLLYKNERDFIQKKTPIQ